MRATVELPDLVLDQLEMLAGQEGAAPSDLIRRIVEDRLGRRHASAQRSFNVSLPPDPRLRDRTDPTDHRQGRGSTVVGMIISLPDVNI